MNRPFTRLALAITFSPTAAALLGEAWRLKQWLNAELVLIHAGEKTPEAESKLTGLLAQASLPADTPIAWQRGKPAEAILKACQENGIDLLLMGALKKENLVGYYVGTVARTIMRKASCSIYVLTQPSESPRPLKNIVVNAEDSPHIREALHIGCWMAARDKDAWLHVVRELKLMGLALVSADQCSEEEYSNVQQNLLREEFTAVESLMRSIPHEGLKVNIKVLSGKSGFELARFAERKEADLLIVGAPPRKFSLFDRVFPHDLEYIFAELPCDLMIVNPRKGAPRG
ncbi:MAG: universal stress protein [Cyclobacteriaceae bacterium]|jgi:nucleotide-binding universal stress UspA family protein|nr:universal stress protein [Cyclobacteriaceae bacterium]